MRLPWVRALAGFVAVIVVFGLVRDARANPGPPDGYFHTCAPELQCPRGGVLCRDIDPDGEDCVAGALGKDLVERCRHYHRRVFCPRDAPLEGAPGLPRSPNECTVAAQCPMYGLEWSDDEPPVPYADLLESARLPKNERWVTRCTAWPGGRAVTVICPISTWDMMTERHPFLPFASYVCVFAIVAIGVTRHHYRSRRRARDGAPSSAVYPRPPLPDDRDPLR